MSIVIRKAIITDCEALLDLIKELAIYEKEPKAVTVSLEHFKQSGFGANPVYWAIVAEHNKIIVGFALYYIRYSTWIGQTMYLEDIIVTESARGNKIGALLFNFLINEAKEKKLVAINWQVLDWNTPAINFYKKYPCTFDDNWVNCKLVL
ncbi:MAG: GNAT family N-acetyltransferase [Alphaproteobacteria bacterium]|nr:GNAT family N-acetyltransferase [Alphaproteobacteria bacterium]